LLRNRLKLVKKPKRISLPTNGPRKTSGQCRHVLLVEDHEPTRLALAQLLLHRRFKVASAASLAQARLLMKQTKDFELLISDLDLPDGSGYDLMNEFQKKFAAKGIVVTGHGTEEDVAHSQSLGFTAHLTKPVRIESLESALTAALRESAHNIFIKNGMPR
jgi:DNA-binding NtrC family response regulator